MGERVTINEVGPRDGLQNQPRILEPAERLRLIDALLDAGLRPKAVPAMAGAAEVLAGLPGRSDAVFTALIPNMKGYELATAAGARSVSMVLYGTDGMAQANARMDSAAAEAVTAEILARELRKRVTVSI